MQRLKSTLQKLKKTQLQVAGVVLLMLLAILLVLFNNANSNQAIVAMMAQVYFDGEYRIDDGEWHKIVEGEHISSTEGDVTLRGNLHMLTPDGEYVGVYREEIPVAFYTNHIRLTFYDGQNEPVTNDMENPIYGSSACGAGWTAFTFTSAREENIEIVIHNPHLFGNENAIDEMLSSLALWSGIEFQNDVLKSGEGQRNVGILLMVVSLIFLGTALFSTLIRIKNSRMIWVIGLLVLSAGLFFVYSSSGISFWSDSVVSNTTILGCSMMFYMLFLMIATVSLLTVTKKLGNITVIGLTMANAVFLILPIVSRVYFYDTWLWWVVVQLIANLLLAVCLIREFFSNKTGARWFYIGAFLPLIAFDIDVLVTWLGIFQRGAASMYVFTILFVIATVMVLKLIPNNINAAAKAKELEVERIVLNAQLAESRISTMMSQIRPHFIYNTLGSIEQLCKLDPPKAGDLVHNFAKYLRGNFGELDNPKPILMSQEMEHVRHYISIENVRFPDMTFTFEMNSQDFCIPALTVQPIVENAIKHGLMRLQKGGTIHVVSYETDDCFCVSVVDDGVGFDTTAIIDDRKHVGLRNIRERLKVMVNGELEIESTVGVGTKVLIKIPKEARR